MDASGMRLVCRIPNHSNMAESVNTLRYAGRAMNIKNTAVKNEGVAGAPVSYAEVGTRKVYPRNPAVIQNCLVFFLHISLQII